MKYIPLLALLFTLHSPAMAEYRKFSPSDSAIWQEKPTSDAGEDQEKRNSLCGIFPDVVCPQSDLNGDGEESYIEREAQRRKELKQQRDREEWVR